MFTQIIYKNTNFHIYEIDENGIIKKNGVILSNNDIVYHSTNGYDYVLLEQFDGSSILLPLDQVLFNSFHRINIYTRMKCIHLNGETRDNRLCNLNVVEDVEEWRTVSVPECIKRDTWKISSFGRLVNITSNQFIKGSINKGYIEDCFTRHDCDKIKYITRHRLVSLHFLDNPDTSKYVCINHIDGNKSNNHYMNLEWVDHKTNNSHALLTKLSPHYTKISNDDIDMIIEMLLSEKYLYNPRIVYDNLDHNKFPYITLPIIQNIKQKSNTYVRSNCKYDLSTINFNEAIRLPELRISCDEFDMIIEMLLDSKYHYSPSIIYNSINKIEHPNITKSIISLIKQKKISMLHSKKYKNYDFNFPESGPPTSEIDLVISMLLDVKYDGRVTDVYNAIDHDSYPNISKSMIDHIKHKHPAYIRHDSKYDLMSLEFKKHINKSV